MFVVGQSGGRQRVDDRSVGSDDARRRSAEPIVAGDGAPPAAEVVPLAADRLPPPVDHAPVRYALRPRLADQHALGTEEVELARRVRLARHVQRFHVVAAVAVYSIQHEANVDIGLRPRYRGTD